LGTVVVVVDEEVDVLELVELLELDVEVLDDVLVEVELELLELDEEELDDELVEVDVEVLVEVLVEVDVEVLVDVLELLVDVLVDVVVVWQAFVQASVLLALPSSQASPDVLCTTPSPQMVHGFGSLSGRQVLSLASAAGQPPVGLGGVPQFTLPDGQH
jgi:hypothetical protein